MDKKKQRLSRKAGQVWSEQGLKNRVKIHQESEKVNSKHHNSKDHTTQTEVSTSLTLHVHQIVIKYKLLV